jgi:hypothetical protein
MNHLQFRTKLHAPTDPEGDGTLDNTKAKNGEVRLVTSTSVSPLRKPCAPDGRADEVEHELCSGLTAIERRIWLKIISGQSIRAIAVQARLPESEILFRVCGNGLSPGMTQKNRYVARWWQLHVQSAGFEA